jgi:pSer/pThr/pTyr-binding forkhead associated (FHA) protein
VARLELRKVRQVSRLEFGEKPITVGRSSDNSLVLTDTHVSRHHCVIEAIDGTPHVRDLKSHGGTFLNGKRVEHSPLHHGDRVSIGPFDLLFKDPHQHISGNGELPIAIASSDDTGHGDHAHSAQDVSLDIENHALAARLAELEQRESELAEREANFEQRQSLTRNENAAQLAELKSELELRTQEQAAHTERIAALLEQADASRSLIEQLNSKVEQLSAASLAAQKRVDELETQHARETSQASETLAAAQTEINRLRSHEATLQEHVDALQAARQSATERAEQSAHALAALRSQVRSLDDAARKVTAIQDRLAEIESAFVELDEQLENAAEADDDQLENAAMQRQQISAELESLNQLRDAAVTRLSESAQELRSASDQQAMQITVIRNASRPTATANSHSARRWWKFGRKH